MVESSSDTRRWYPYVLVFLPCGVVVVFCPGIVVGAICPPVIPYVALFTKKTDTFSPLDAA